MDGIESTCAFTGHRPERLQIPEGEVQAWLERQVQQAVADGYTRFISGMQRGVDIWAAEAVLELREASPGISLVAAIAFEGMERGWDGGWRGRYARIIDAADEVRVIGERPGRRAFFERNDWMVDNSSRLIAVYSGAPGGTRKTIERAERLGREVVALAR